VNPFRGCFAFMKRHERVFLGSGFLIVFVTFVVRDILLDRARAIAETLSVAETAYLLEDAAVQLHHEIDEVDGHVMAGNSDLLNEPPSDMQYRHISPDVMSFLNRDSIQNLRMDSEANTEFACLYRLLEALPSNNTHRTDFSKLYLRWDKDRMDLLRTPPPPIGAKVDPVIAKSQAEEDAKLRQDMWVINGQLQLLSASILDDAQRTLEGKEHEATAFAWLSYALYFVGFVLAFGGKMAGLETVGV